MLLKEQTKPLSALEKAKLDLKDRWEASQRSNSIVDWAETHRIIPVGDSIWPGRFSFSQVPFMREIAECFSPNSPVKEVAFKKGSQVMGTTCLTENIIGFYMHAHPSNIMLVSSSVDIIETNMQPRLVRMIHNSPLANRIKQIKRGLIMFEGGQLFLAGASNPNKFRSSSIRILILEELTGYPPSAKKEGSVKDLAKARTSTYALNKKILYISSALNNRDDMDTLFLDGDCRYYFVPCPHCGHRQKLIFEQLKYRKDEQGRVKKHSVYYECIACKKYIKDHHKPEMFNKGSWLATQPENTREDYRSYHLSALYAPYGLKSWAEICQEYEQARADSQDELRVFYNTVLGENFSESLIAAPSLSEVIGRMQNGKISYLRGQSPMPILFATIGVDVQKDRLELEVVGWCARKINYSIDYFVFTGDPDLLEDPNGCWAKLSRLLDEIKRQKVPHVCLIDSGHKPENTYDYIAKYRQKTWTYPIKGESPTNANYPYKVLPVTGYLGMQRLHINTPYFKSLFFADSFQMMPSNGLLPPRFVGFPRDYSIKHQERLYFSERPDIVKTSTGERTVWTQVKKENHPLDCRVYAMAGAFWIREFISKNILDLERTDADAAEAYLIEAEKSKILDLRGILNDTTDY